MLQPHTKELSEWACAIRITACISSASDQRGSAPGHTSSCRTKDICECLMLLGHCYIEVSGLWPELVRPLYRAAEQHKVTSKAEPMECIVFHKQFHIVSHLYIHYKPLTCDKCSKLLSVFAYEVMGEWIRNNIKISLRESVRGFLILDRGWDENVSGPHKQRVILHNIALKYCIIIFDTIYLQIMTYKVKFNP